MFVQLGSFAIKKGSQTPSRQSFNFNAPTTLNNAMRIVRACQVPKPILLEGSPGVGKTSLITALANLSGHKLCRINLSDQTDLIDLFGSDLPVEGGAAGEFAWKDAEFLRALQEGHWVLLDEMNLAPQAVLEGLNAVLDHRGTVYIPELNRSFERHPSFRIFAAQNPLHQGGGRKGLPKSFVNRFAKVFVDELSKNDFYTVCSHIFPDIEEPTLRAMITFNNMLNDHIVLNKAFAQEGSPWEFNLRDVIRWGMLISKSLISRHPQTFLRSVYLQRFRSFSDRKSACVLFEQVFSSMTRALEDAPSWTISSSEAKFGHYLSRRRNLASSARPNRILKMQLSVLESLGDCVSQSWLAILTGPKSSGKTEVVRTLASLSGNTLSEVPINSATDTMDILGSFEQVDSRRRLLLLIDKAFDLLNIDLRSARNPREILPYQRHLSAFQRSCQDPSTTNTRALARQMLAVFSQLIQHQTLSGAAYRDIYTSVEKLVSVPTTAGQFEWIDGPLVKAMKLGHWILLDGANLCGPSVLDRLNSLCEPDGCLTLSERGLVEGEVQQIKPHPNFRIFMAVDPHHGELSRAMRNRGIEIAMFPRPSPDDVAILRDHYHLPISLAGSLTNVDSADFDASRRGLLYARPPGTTSLRSTGRSLDQDSALSCLVDHSPALLLSSQLSGEESPWVHFLTQALPPRYMKPIMRYCALVPAGAIPPLIQEFIQSFPQTNVNGALQRLRNSYIEQYKTSLEFALSQPMNVYLSEGRLDGTRDAEETDRRTAIYEVLRLSAGLFTSEHQLFPETETHQHLSEKNRQIYKTVVAIHEEIIRTARFILSSSSSTIQMEEVRLASQLLELGPQLRSALAHASYDFSTLYAISNWLRDLLEDSSSTFVCLVDHSHTLNALASLSSGLGLFVIWSRLYIEEPSPVQHDSIRRIDRMACSLRNAAAVSDIRRQSFHVMAIESLPRTLKQQGSKTLPDLHRNLKECLESSASEDLESSTSIDANGVLLKLQLLAGCGRKANVKISQTLLTGIVELACGNKKDSLAHLVPYQHLIWAVEAQAVGAQLCWLEDLWNAKAHCLRLVNGSMPRKTSNEFDSDLGRVPLRSLQVHDDLLHRQVQVTALESARGADRMDEMTCILFQSLSLIADIHASSFEPAIYQAIQHAASSNKGDFSESIYHMLSLLQSSNDSALVAAVEKELTDVIKISPFKTPSQALGVAWLGISKLLLKLFIPDIPIDPAAVQCSTDRRLRFAEAHIIRQLQLHRSLEGFVTGNENNDVSLRLEEQLSDITVQLGRLPNVPKRSDVHRLHLFWSEVHQFQKNILPASKIEPLLYALLEGNDEAYLRERVLQESLSGFSQRLDLVYPDFADINIALKLAINYMRLGLRVVVECSEHTLSHSHSQWAASLLAFPSACSSTKIIDNVSKFEPSHDDAFNHVLLALSAFAFLRSVDPHDDRGLSWLDNTYEQLTRLWLIDRAKEKQRDLEANSLYRRSKIDYTAVTDASVEEEDFLSLFPNFEEALDAEAQKSISGQQCTSQLVQPKDMNDLLCIHHCLLDPQIESTRQRSLLRFQDMRRSCIRSVISTYFTALPEDLDRAGVPTQFSLLHGSILSLEDRESDVSSYNFYADANYKEVKRCASILSSLRGKLQRILEEWPDQMVVRHLMDRCDDILNASSESPIARLLSMVEQLLVQSEDWEMYSNRTNSIKSHQEEIVRLVVDWRRLELSCWQGLLDSQTRAFSDDVSEWWFRLYDAVVRGTLSASTEQLEKKDGTLDSYVDSLIPLLDSFMTSSPLGQFHARLKLLRSFENYVALIGPSKPSNEQIPLQRVGRVLSATCAYYSLFSEPLQQRFLQEKAPLESEVKALIKLASWKDVNVQALKQSAQKSHRQLYKIVKKFRDVLRQPIAQHLHVQAINDNNQLASPEKTFDPIPCIRGLDRNIPSISSSLPHLLDLQTTLKKFSSIVGDQLLPFIHAHLAQSVDDAAVEIITTSRNLASLGVPPSLSSEQREKHRKALLVRKRKAWADMLKELKRAGLSSNVAPEILRQNTSRQWVREQAQMPRISSSDIDVTRGEIYFTKLCDTLPSLRASLPAHHSDLNTRELTRCQMFLEAGFSMAIDLRSRLAGALEMYHLFVLNLRRLQTLSSSKGVKPIDNACANVSATKARLCNSAQALKDLRDQLLLQKQLRAIDVDDAFLDEISSIIDSTESLIPKVDTIWRDLTVAPVTLITRDEEDALWTAERHLQQIMQAISEWKKQEPRLEYLLSPIQRWLDHSPFVTEHDVEPRKKDPGTVEKLLTSLLISVQYLATRASRQAADLAPEEDKYIVTGYQSIRDTTHHLNLKKVKSELDEVLVSLSSEADFRRTTDSILPFLEIYSDLVRNQLGVHCDWVKSLFKLDYVLCSVLQTLSQQGFCQPAEPGKDDGGEGETLDSSGGVGIGEGSGTNNVSKEIEDESQIEGLQGENEENKDPDGKHDDGEAIEMADDVGGTMEDVPEPGSEDDVSSQDGSEPEFDETIADLDELDPSAVDEKIWSDEKSAGDTEEGEKKADHDHSNTQTESSEVVAKDRAEQKKQDDSKTSEENAADDNGCEVEESRNVEEEAEEDKDPVNNGAQMDEYVPEANTLDLPDEMDLGKQAIQGRTTSSWLRK
ncbi:hypothetical protein CVT26_015129 [Gymnopilus dilepis]|uniref:AAA+ ATPase domain-containing protein n=1 Tax=Gymnopilus dilepis TaxID=231916 RepID=A0A409WRY9_9AGAR|nr:hypothetical protein CVT26_015129 [Gymnopilus dilepis]